MDNLTKLEETERKVIGMSEVMRRLSIESDNNKEESFMFGNFCDDLRGIAADLHEILLGLMQQK